MQSLSIRSKLFACASFALSVFFATNSFADVAMYSQAAANDANILVQYSFDGANTTERQEDKSAGTNNLVIQTQGTGNGALISYGSGFDGSSDAVTPQRINNSNGAAFRTGSNLDLTGNTSYSFEAIIRMGDVPNGDFGYLMGTRAAANDRNYWGLQVGQTGTNADDLVALAGDDFNNNRVDVAVNYTVNDWYFMAVTQEDLGATTRINTWLANLSNGETTLTLIESNQIVDGTFRNNNQMGVGILNNIGTFQQVFSGSIDEISLYNGLRTEADFQASLDIITAIPEPSSLLLLSLSSVGCAYFVRRKKLLTKAA